MTFLISVLTYKHTLIKTDFERKRHHSGANKNLRKKLFPTKMVGREPKISGFKLLLQRKDSLKNIRVKSMKLAFFASSKTWHVKQVARKSNKFCIKFWINDQKIWSFRFFIGLILYFHWCQDYSKTPWTHDFFPFLTHLRFRPEINSL